MKKSSTSYPFIRKTIISILFLYTFLHLLGGKMTHEMIQEKNTFSFLYFYFVVVLII